MHLYIIYIKKRIKPTTINKKKKLRKKNTWFHHFIPKSSSTRNSQDSTLLSLLRTRLKRCFRGRLEDLPNAVFRLRRALQIGDRVNRVRHLPALLVPHRLFFHFGQLAPRELIIAQVFFIADQNDGHARTKVSNLGLPLLRYILQTVWIIDSEAHHNNVRVRVRQRSESIVVFLAGQNLN